MRQLIADMIEFHQMGAHPILDTPQFPDERRVALRIEVVEEEVNRELIPAIKARDLVATADAIIDSIYALVGMALEFGLDLGPLWNEVHAANMRKRGGPIREDGKHLKPPGWVGPNIQKHLNAQIMLADAGCVPWWKVYAKGE